MRVGHAVIGVMEGAGVNGKMRRSLGHHPAEHFSEGCGFALHLNSGAENFAGGPNTGEGGPGGEDERKGGLPERRAGLKGQAQGHARWSGGRDEREGGVEGGVGVL